MTTSKVHSPKSAEIHIKGARTNNLKNVELRIPKNQLVVVTGVSGSGKSSLVMDTLYAEGQRRYVESMSSYARQFLGRVKKPDVDFIKGISPAIAIEQRVTSSNARSTVGSMTEILDYLRLLFARIGQTISPISGAPVKRHTVSDVIHALQAQEEGSKVQLLAPLQSIDSQRSVAKEFELLLQKGYTRILYQGDSYYIEDFIAENEALANSPIQDLIKDVAVLIDRFVIKKEDEDNWKRIADSIETAFYEGGGDITLDIIKSEKLRFNNRFELDGITFLEPSPQLFNYNNPYGACSRCEGYGKILGLDPNKIIPDKSLSLYEGAVVCWRGEKHGMWRDMWISKSDQLDFPIFQRIAELTDEQRNLLWHGSKDIEGIYDFFQQIEAQNYKIQNRVLLSRYRGRTKCTSCDGKRLRKEAQYVKIDGYDITQLFDMPIGDLKEWFTHVSLTEWQEEVGARILLEIRNRLNIMCDIGLSYLSLDRQAYTLSGGETQRISLTRTLGSNLTSSIYILDEPSIGLHPRDTAKLIEVLKNLRDLGNTVVVVEHEEEVIRNADVLVDVGPHAGVFGGEIVFIGAPNQLSAHPDSLTMQYLNGQQAIPIPDLRRQSPNAIRIIGASHHNLKNIDVQIPLQSLTVITGVSGSGKSTLMKHILYPALLNALNIKQSQEIGAHLKIGGASLIKGVEMVGQSSIGRSSRSNPATYIKAYDEIRKLMIKQPLSKIRGYKPRHFSFNTEGGRCENCKGDGYITVEMQFLADVRLVCEDCKGRRFKPEILEVTYKDKNIYDILNLSVDESLAFFEDQPKVVEKIQPLTDVGLGYVQLGQASNTLSGGEAQRVKLASYLSKENRLENQLFIFDEPTTGLHFDDIKKLLKAFQALIEQGHSVVIVEHNMDVIKCADWLIDLGPEGGHAGGYLVYQGPPEGLLAVENSYTAQFLKDKLKETS